MSYLNGGYRQLEELLKKVNGGRTVIKASMIGAVLRRERRDMHGVLELFKEVTDAEMKRRQEQAKELAKQLQP